MTNFNDQTPPEVDPFQTAAEQLLYGDPEHAAKVLRDAIYAGASHVHQHQSRQGAVNRELESSKAVAEAFANENPDWAKDPMVVDAVKAGMRVEQLEDLRKAGVDIGKWAESLDRVPTPDDIFNAHLQMRVAGNPDVRTPKQLFDDVADQMESEFGVRRRLRSEDANRKRAVRDRMKVSANSHGMSLEEYDQAQLPSRMPSYSTYDGEPVTTQSIQESTLRAFGHGVGDEADASRKANHRTAIQRMQASRAPTKMAPQFQVDSDANSRRYPDRRQATG